MSLDLGFVMDPIESINPKKDSTLAMLLAAQARGWRPWILGLGDLRMADGRAYGRMRAVQVRDDPTDWFEYGESRDAALDSLDVILMRKDPPFDMEYVYATYLLERAEAAGVLVVNRPQSLRDANEKVFTAWFSDCTPPTLITRSQQDARDFLGRHEDIIVKPLDGMGGASIFRVAVGDPNVGVILETLSRHDSRYFMAQKYVPEITAGDKRILLIDGRPVPYGLARVPAKGETRGNLAAGATGEGRELSERDLWICNQVGPKLREKGLLFVGLDVIGRYLTEVNVTSPTCIRELDQIYGLNIAADLMQAISTQIRTRDRE